MPSINPELKFTYHDYLNLPEEKQSELIHGDFYMVPAPGPYHQVVVARIQWALHQFVESRMMGLVISAPCDVYFSQYDVVQPDLLFIRRERKGMIKEKYVDGPPDLVVEVLSQTTANVDRQLKRKLYARHGVMEYWIVDPEAKTIQVLPRRAGKLSEGRRFTGNEKLVSSLLEGFTLNPSDIFAPL